MAGKMTSNFDWDTMPDMNSAKDVRDTKMLDANARETRDEGPNELKQQRESGGKPKGPFGMHK